MILLLGFLLLLFFPFLGFSITFPELDNLIGELVLVLFDHIDVAGLSEACLSEEMLLELSPVLFLEVNANHRAFFLVVVELSLNFLIVFFVDQL